MLICLLDLFRFLIEMRKRFFKVLLKSLKGKDLGFSMMKILKYITVGTLVIMFIMAWAKHQNIKVNLKMVTKMVGGYGMTLAIIYIIKGYSSRATLMVLAT